MWFNKRAIWPFKRKGEIEIKVHTPTSRDLMSLLDSTASPEVQEKTRKVVDDDARQRRIDYVREKEVLLATKVARLADVRSR